MEGWNPTIGCTLRCSSGCRGSGWVPAPRSSYPRRDPFIDAVGRTDDPCERPARCPPCCQPTPKFRLPQFNLACNLNCYRPEQAAAKYQEALIKQCQQLCCNPCDNGGRMEVTLLDPCHPVIYQQEQMPSPDCIFNLREQACKSEIIAGFFNPDDNKTADERMRESCDVFYRSCGSKLKPYPCRGVITFPPRRYVSLAEESRTCYPSICAGSKYISPEYLAQQAQQEELRMQEMTMRQQLQQTQASAFRGCTSGRCGCD